MIGVVDHAAAVDDHLGVAAQNRVRLEGPDLADEHLAQRQVVREHAVGLMEERDTAVTHYGRRLALLVLALQRKLHLVEIRVFTTRIAGGAADEPALGARIDPRRRGARGPTPL